MNYEPIIKPINFDIVDVCREYLKTNNLANRGKHDGTKKQQLVGLVGEMESNYLLKGFYPDLKEKGKGFDGGFDIVLKNYKIDVKSMERKVYTKPHYANNFPRLQDHYNPDILLFTSINKSTYKIEFCGWIWKKELNEKSILYEKGSVRKRGHNDIMVVKEDNYEVLCSDVRDIRKLIIY